MVLSTEQEDLEHNGWCQAQGDLEPNGWCQAQKGDLVPNGWCRAQKVKNWYLMDGAEQNKTRVLLAGNNCDGVGHVKVCARMG